MSEIKQQAEWALELECLAGTYVVCRLEAGAAVPDDCLEGELACLTRTAEETSVLCAAGREPDGAQIEGPFRALKVAGPLDFSLTGILAAIAGVLAEAKVSIFAVSTFDTDYVLVGADAIDSAVSVLEAAGHRVAESVCD